MLNTDQLENYCDRHRLSPAARQVIERIRMSRPVRRVQAGSRNVTARFASRKMACVIQAESHKNELPAIIGWEFDNSTYEFYDQASQIKVSYIGAKDRRITHMMTPDFFLLQEGFAGWVECKTEEWLKGRAEEGSVLYVFDGGRWRCPPAEEYAESFGLGFRVRSSTETNWDAVSNATFLADYLDGRMPPVSSDQASRILSVFERQAFMTLRELLDADHGIGADVIYRMIAEGSLYVDLANERLADVDRTRVFRDIGTAQAYRLHMQSRRRPAAGDIKPISVAPGQSLMWDGKPWRIANVGAEDVYLEDSDRVFTPIPRNVLNQLVRDGKITGLPGTQVATRRDADVFLSKASPTDIAHALKRYRALFPNKHDGGLAVEVSDRALRKWRALYRHAEATIGSGFAGLLPKLHLRGNRHRKLDSAVIKIMNDVIDELYAVSGQATLVRCWGEVQIRCEQASLPVPSEEAFRLEVRRRPLHALQSAREGEKAAYETEEFYWSLERTIPRHGERPFEIGHIDHTQLDLQFVGRKEGETKKAWLTMMVDAYTRLIVAFVVSFDAPSYRSCMAVIRDCVRRHNRVPATLVVDGGSEFNSVYFESLLAHLETHKKSRPGSKARFGSVIERMFGISNRDFIHNLRGNNQALQKPRRLSKSHDPRLLAVWTLMDFRDAFDGYLERVYHATEHPALGTSPQDAMAAGLAQFGPRQHRLIPYGDEFIVMCMPTTKKGTVTLDPARGVKILYRYYWTPEFRNPRLANQRLAVRYDPDNMSRAFVWLKDHWAVCRSEFAADFEGITETEIEAATLKIREQDKRARRNRSVSARMLAEYFREINATEARLLERKAQAETSSHPPLNGAKPADPPELVPDQSVWANLNLEFFGEFK